MQTQPNDIVSYIISWLDDQTKLVVVSRLSKRFNQLVKLPINMENNLEKILIHNKYLSYESVLSKIYLEINFVDDITNEIILNIVSKILNNDKLIIFLKKNNKQHDKKYDRYFEHYSCSVILWCLNNSFTQLIKILYPKIRSYFLRYMFDSIISTAVKMNNIEILDYIIDQEISLECSHLDGWTLNKFLEPAMLADNVEIIKYCIKRGMDISKTSYNRPFLIDCAQKNNSLKILEYLNNEFRRIDNIG